MQFGLQLKTSLPTTLSSPGRHKDAESAGHPQNPHYHPTAAPGLIASSIGKPEDGA